jgi:hypothetical protein
MALRLDPNSPSEHQAWLTFLFRVLRDAWVWVTDESTRLAVAGIIWFSVLTVTYEQFYGRLGISVSDVGLSYVNLLTGSVGTALIVLGATILFTFLVLSGIMILSWVVPKIRTLSGDVQYRLTASLLIIICRRY